MSELAKSLFPSISKLKGPILITGHTGFVGTWTMMVLRELEIPFVGFSKEPLEGSMFERLGLTTKFGYGIGDLRDSKQLSRFINYTNPSVIIHLAADALVLEAIQSPKSVMDNNFNSTLSVISEFVEATQIQRMLVSTTDKVYRNLNLPVFFKELDPLEGSEPYSESKVATEALIRGFNSILPKERQLIVARAGNIIGGGDFANNRLIPDIVRSRISGTNILLRFPTATRPWQHVLDVVVGYLTYLEKSLTTSDIPLALNFGSHNSSKSVSYVVDRAIKTGFIARNFVLEDEKTADVNSMLEKHFLALDPSLAREKLHWENIFDVDSAVDITLNWWRACLECPEDADHITRIQIQDYLSIVSQKSTK